MLTFKEIYNKSNSLLLIWISLKSCMMTYSGLMQSRHLINSVKKKLPLKS